MLQSALAHQAADVYSMTEGKPGAVAMGWASWVVDAVNILSSAVAHRSEEARANG